MTEAVTTESVRTAAPARAAASEDAALADRRGRYIADVLALHDRISLRGLAAQVDPLYMVRRPDGLTVLAVPQSGLPERYRLMIYGFRLAQYLRLNYASDRIAHDAGLFAEPHEGHGEEIHVIALQETTGAILRYVSYIGTEDTRPRSLTDPDRVLFPAEVAHGVNFFDHVPAPEPALSNEVWEIKRLVQRGSELRAPVTRRLRITLEMMLCFYSTLQRLSPKPKYLIGDGEEGLAIRRLTRSLKDITVIEGTTPSLPEDDLHFPLYVTRPVVKPFVARAPYGDELADLVQWMETALATTDPLAGFRQLVARVEGEIRRVQV
ncbi:hypothetical protein [Actinacidiphila sp. ITFR-21]|uniref:hypothetical protein n=1 Tax=Actinacidiphila sp. ITFR-21 TaxID=3075199 RepID=UPI0028893C17|nr:hypothetical protein [Streptomyces sp. ITFR-21]WNI17993.1 hypothetical protein RLT57_22225 [Streptomyces sp. ITFR-21]